MTDPVECLSDSSYAERPVALTWQGERLEISRILSRWQSPGARHFRVETSTGQVFDLTYNETSYQWEVHQI